MLRHDHASLLHGSRDALARDCCGRRGASHALGRQQVERSSTSGSTSDKQVPERSGDGVPEWRYFMAHGRRDVRMHLHQRLYGINVRYVGSQWMHDHGPIRKRECCAQPGDDWE